MCITFDRLFFGIFLRIAGKQKNLWILGESKNKYTIMFQYCIFEEAFRRRGRLINCNFLLFLVNNIYIIHHPLRHCVNYIKNGWYKILADLKNLIPPSILFWTLFWTILFRWSFNINISLTYKFCINISVASALKLPCPLLFMLMHIAAIIGKKRRMIFFHQKWYYLAVMTVIIATFPSRNRFNTSINWFVKSGPFISFLFNDFPFNDFPCASAPQSNTTFIFPILQMLYTSWWGMYMVFPFVSTLRQH